MPDFSTLLVFSVAALALIAVPGPNIIYIVTRGMGQGRKAAVASALGVETGTLFHVAAAALGLSALLASSAFAFNVVKYLGAAYLVYLGVRTLLGGDDDGQPEERADNGRLWRVYLQGVVVNALNPKVALFFLAFLPQFVDPSRAGVTAQVFVLGVVAFFIGLCVDLLYATSSGALGGWLRRRPAFLRQQRYFTGSVYLALGAAAALAGSDRGRG